MAENKKLIRIEPLISNGGDAGFYISDRIKFALVAKNDNIRRQVAKFCTCRDYLNDILRARAHNKSYSGLYNHDPDSKFVVDMSRIRLLIGRDNLDSKKGEEFKQKIFSAKRLINFYENEGGWEDRSVITTVLFKKDEISNTKTNAWLLTGPKEWVSYSQLTSMVTFIFRVISNYGPIEFNNNDDIEKWFYKLVLKAHAKRMPYDTDVNAYLSTCWDKFYMIATCYKDIFTQPLEEAYPESGNIHGPGGIYHLCSFLTQNKTLDNKMKTVYEKYLKDTEKHKKELIKEAEEEFKHEKPSKDTEKHKEELIKKEQIYK